jgi:hypothetical protein
MMPSLSTHRKCCKHALETPFLALPSEIQVPPITGKVMLTVSFDISGVLMLAFKDPDITVNTQSYCGTSKMLVLPSSGSIPACLQGVSP